jgi:hypothetical protein
MDRQEIKIDVNGKWIKRRCTATEFRAYLDAQRPFTHAISEAFKRGDAEAVERHQETFRRQIFVLPGEPA